MKTDALATFFGREDIEGLWIADMDFAVAPEITSALARRFSHAIYGYSAVPESYWQSIIDWLRTRHGWHVGREDLIYVNGVVKGIGFLINYFTRPGDKMLIQPPVYHPFRRLIEENGRVCVTSPLRRTATGYEMDLDDLEEKFRIHRPAMMILCNPITQWGCSGAATPWREWQTWPGNMASRSSQTRSTVTWCCGESPISRSSRPRRQPPRWASRSAPPQRHSIFPACRAHGLS